MPVPIVYRKASDVSATYSYTDIASGTGVQDFYLAKTVDKNVLTATKFYSHKVSSNVTYGSTGGDLTVQDIDFDVTFQLPKTIKGVVVATIPHGTKSGSNSHDASTITAILRKWNGTTETDLVTNTGRKIDYAASTAGLYNKAMDSIDLEVTETHFKKGETLRLTVRQIADSGSTSTLFAIGCDPLNRVSGGAISATPAEPDFDWGSTPSIATLQVPFKLDL